MKERTDCTASLLRKRNKSFPSGRLRENGEKRGKEGINYRKIERKSTKKSGVMIIDNTTHSYIKNSSNKGVIA